jgi:hypothetical protein
MYTKYQNRALVCLLAFLLQRSVPKPKGRLGGGLSKK